VSPSPATRESGGVVSSPSGAANDFGAFLVHFMQFHASFNAFNSSPEMGDFYTPLLASRFDISL